MKTIKKSSLIIIGLLICISCSKEQIESNPFLGTWHGHEATFENGITLNTDYLLTFFDDYTYSVEIDYSTIYASETMLITGKYSFNNDDKIWFNDDGKLFGNGGYCNYSLYNGVLKLEWSNKTMIFRR